GQSDGILPPPMPLTKRDPGVLTKRDPPERERFCCGLIGSPSFPRSRPGYTVVADPGREEPVARTMKATGSDKKKALVPPLDEVIADWYDESSMKYRISIVSESLSHFS